MDSDSELNKALYCLINLLLVAVSVFLQRRIFIVCGALGIFGYLEHLAEAVFKDSLAFPFALSGLGLAIIYLGIAYQRHRETIEQSILSNMPGWLLSISPVNRGK